MNSLIATPSQRSEFYLDLLSDKNPNVRKKAAESVGKVGDASILARLEMQLKWEAEQAVRQAIEDAIAKIRRDGLT